MLNGISNAVFTIGLHLRGVASRVGSAGVSGFSVAPQTVRLTPVRFHSPFSPGSSNINARTTFNMSHMSQMSQMSRMSQMATSFTPTRPAPPPPTSGQASGSAG
ncbi:secretion protein EspF, partial [Escherichia coli]|nr:secretion protein EspF [Escherichia coli]